MKSVKPRRPNGIRTKKVSLSISAEDLEVLTEQARQEHGGNLSAVVHDLVVGLKHQRGLEELSTWMGSPRATEAELQALRDEIAAAPTGLDRQRPGPRAKRRRVA